MKKNFIHIFSVIVLYQHLLGMTQQEKDLINKIKTYCLNRPRKNFCSDKYSTFVMKFQTEHQRVQEDFFKKQLKLKLDREYQNKNHTNLSKLSAEIKKLIVYKNKTTQGKSEHDRKKLIKEKVFAEFFQTFSKL